MPITQTGAVFGTPLFMSPEQCRGRAIDARTDLYSFGVLAYCVLAGQPPFEGDALALALHHLNDAPEPPSRHRPELPSHVDRVVLELLAKDPVDRPSPLAKAIAAIEGSIRLPRRIRRAWIAVPVVAALAAVGIVIATKSAPGAVVADSDCAPGADRIAPFWNASIADAAASKFDVPDRPAVAASWKLGRPQIDALAARWAGRWDAACKSADRTTAPLLYGERIACLDTALLDLRISITSILQNPRSYRFNPNFDAGTGGRSLEDCDSRSVLKAQVDPPPAAARDRVNTLLLAAFGENTKASEAANERRTSDADRSLAELDRISRELELLDPPSASIPILNRAGLLLSIARDVDSTRLVAARIALDDAIHRIEAAHDDVALAEAYIALAWFEVAAGDLDSLERANDAATLAERALERAGSPLAVQRDLLELRAGLFSEHGDFVAAAATARKAIELASARGGDEFSESELVVALALGGHEQEAISKAHAFVTERTAKYGNIGATMAFFTLARACDQGGDEPCVLSATTRAVEFRTFAPGIYKPWHDVYMLDVGLRAGRSELDGDAVVKALEKMGTTPVGQNSDGIATARRAGLFAVFAYAADRPNLTDDDRRADNAATFEFERGDLVAAVRRAKACATNCTSWVAFSRWLAVLEEPNVEDRFAKLEAEYAGRAAAVANSGVLLASLGRWSEATPKLEAARGKPNIWEIQADLVELDAWLALARLHAGDRTGARPLLVEALGCVSILHNAVAGFSYMTPVANFELAKIVWDEDRTYARVLATRARDGFARFGSFRDPQRLEVTRWLADHAS